MDVLDKIRELAEHEELSSFDASGTPVSSALRMAADEIERLRAVPRDMTNWLRRNANAETEPKARAAFIEAHNALLKIAEGRVDEQSTSRGE